MINWWSTAARAAAAGAAARTPRYWHGDFFDLMLGSSV